MVDYTVAKEVVTSKVEPFEDWDFHCKLCDEILMVHYLAPNEYKGWVATCDVCSVLCSNHTTRE